MEKKADPIEWAVLHYLYDLAARSGGYEHRAVRGWAHHSDVEAGTKRRVGETLSQLHRRGLLDREDVRSAGRQRPVWIYRISEKGARQLAGGDGRIDRTIKLSQPLESGARETTIYLAAGVALALRALRLAWNSGTASLHLPGEQGWRTEKELVVLVCPPAPEQPDWLWDMKFGDPDEWDDPEPWRAAPEPQQRDWPIRFYPEDLWWLVRAGFAQRFAVESESRRQPVLLYRVTPAGCRVDALEWHEPSP